MPCQSRARNPFHPFLLAAGVVFALAACSSSVAYVKQLAGGTGEHPSPSDLARWVWMEQYGGTVLAISLAILAVAAVADLLWEAWGERPPDRGETNSGPLPENERGEPPS